MMKKLTVALAAGLLATSAIAASAQTQVPMTQAPSGDFIFNGFKEKYKQRLISGSKRRITLDGKRFAFAGICLTNNCRGNFFVFLIAMDGPEFYGLMSSEEMEVPLQYFGHPNNEKKRLLFDRMSNLVREGDKYFDTYRAVE
jgi:hypothetical protein